MRLQPLTCQGINLKYQVMKETPSHKKETSKFYGTITGVTRQQYIRRQLTWPLHLYSLTVICYKAWWASSTIEDGEQGCTGVACGCSCEHCLSPTQLEICKRSITHGQCCQVHGQPSFCKPQGCTSSGYSLRSVRVCSYAI